MATIDEAVDLNREWDAIIVGTGIGGATLGYALSEAGQSVLFCERGRYYPGAADTFSGRWLEALTLGQPNGATPAQQQRAGRFGDGLVEVGEGEPRVIHPLLGIGAGGSSALYGMVMERFFPSDFTPKRYFPGAVGALLPEAWPITYDELAPYYTEAERLYRVRAGVDPLRPQGEGRGIQPPPAFNATSAELVTHFQGRGLHPYALPMACDYVPGCQECIGYICAKGCKVDSTIACLQPALERHRAALLSECYVEALEAGRGRVDTVLVRWRGAPVRLRGKSVILAAGAVHTPVILLRSGEGGLANRSDQVGRNLMRHFLDYYVVYTDAKQAGAPVKQVAVNDLYVHDGIKLGTLQSNGILPPASSVATMFKERLRRTWGPLASLYPLVRPFAEFGVRSMLSGAHVLAAIMEDLPYADNRIGLTADKTQVTLHYRISDYDQTRLRTFRSEIAKAIRPIRSWKMLRASENRMLGHVSGTCRFGEDPKTSVLDRDNRAHDLDNLYVVDGSFLPTSGGTNPSLTIAANALRVADRLLAAG